jgi:hypothetical protein
MRVIFITGINSARLFYTKSKENSGSEPSYFDFQACTCLHTGLEGAIPLFNTTSLASG